MRRISVCSNSDDLRRRHHKFLYAITNSWQIVSTADEFYAISAVNSLVKPSTSGLLSVSHLSFHSTSLIFANPKQSQASLISTAKPYYFLRVTDLGSESFLLE
jgi:hypothetical protein